MISPLRDTPTTQTGRLWAYLLDHPRASSLEIIRDLAVTNATGRISDLREALADSDFELVKVKREDGRWGYQIRQRGLMNLGLTA